MRFEKVPRWGADWYFSTNQQKSVFVELSGDAGNTWKGLGTDWSVGVTVRPYRALR